jgi:NAD dependent epimerase/dehydratase family enzyme
MKVAVTGSSGLVGSALVPSLTASGHEVLRLVRRAPKAKDEARWDPEAGTIDAVGLEGLDAVVHLTGENIGEGRWTEARKARLRSSRVGPTQLLARTLAGLEKKPQVLVSISAVGYYGSRGDAWLTEQEAAGHDFLGRLCAEWEGAADPATRAGIRVGPGTQFMSWIALDDLLGVIHHAIDRTDLAGPVNAAAPEPVTNAEFTKTLGRVLRRPTIARVPAFVLRLAYGEMAEATLLSSIRVRAERLLASGYRFRFPELEGALRHVLGRPPEPPGPPMRSGE